MAAIEARAVGGCAGGDGKLDGNDFRNDEAEDVPTQFFGGQTVIGDVPKDGSSKTLTLVENLFLVVRHARARY